MSAVEAELRAEMFAAAKRVKARALDFLKSRGLTGAAFVSCTNTLDGCTPLLGITRIATDGGYFTPADEGPAAFLVAVPDPTGAPADILAFNASTPRQWWLRRGDAAILGEPALDRAMALDEPLPVLSSPLDWLIAGGSGVVLLGPPQHWRAALAGARRLLVDDEALAEEIDREMNRRPNVEIRTRSLRDAA